MGNAPFNRCSSWKCLRPAHSVRFLLFLVLPLLVSAVFSFLAYSEYRRAIQKTHDHSPPLQLASGGDSIDLGSVTWGPHHVHVRLQNRSRHPIRILQVTKQCHCTRVNLPASEIAPGEIFEGDLTWDVAGMSGESSTSIVIHYTERLASEVEQKAAIVSVFANVQPDYVVDPSRLTFTTEGRQAKRLTLIPERVADVTVTSVRSSHPAITADIERDGRHVSVSFSALAWSEIEGPPLHLVLSVSDPILPIIDVPVYISPAKPLRSAGTRIRAREPPFAFEGSRHVRHIAEFERMHRTICPFHYTF